MKTIRAGRAFYAYVASSGEWLERACCIEQIRRRLAVSRSFAGAVNLYRVDNLAGCKQYAANPQAEFAGMHFCKGRIERIARGRTNSA